MRIRKVTIRGLFGMFDHVIPLHTDDRITIVHGPNGVGKTTILRLLAALFSRRHHILRSTPFEQLRVDFDSPGAALLVTKVASKDEERPVELKFSLLSRGKNQEYTTKAPRELLASMSRRTGYRMLEDFVDTLERIGQTKWLDHLTGDILDIDDVVLLYPDRVPFLGSRDILALPDWLDPVLDSVPIHFIQTQRLFATPQAERRERPHRSQRTTSTVERYSMEMVEKIRDVLRESGVLAASLDRTFPHRLLDPAPQADVPETDIRARYEEQASYRNRLMEAGLFDPEAPVALPEGSIDESSRKVLWHYLHDVQQKFQVFVGLLDRVELFKKIINTRFLYKTFAVDKEQGFVFVSQAGAPVPLLGLSSGEQHELVLAFELLFRVKGKSLILIDEPELSLHVTWQHKFLEDLERISELADLDFLVATHSPSIVHDRTDLMVALGGPA